MSTRIALDVDHRESALLGVGDSEVDGLDGLAAAEAPVRAGVVARPGHVLGRVVGGTIRPGRGDLSR